MRVTVYRRCTAGQVTFYQRCRKRKRTNPATRSTSMIVPTPTPDSPVASTRSFLPPHERTFPHGRPQASRCVRSRRCAPLVRQPSRLSSGDARSGPPESRDVRSRRASIQLS